MKIRIDTVSEDELRLALIEALGEPASEKKNLSLLAILAKYDDCGRLKTDLDQFLERRPSRDIDLGLVERLVPPCYLTWIAESKSPDPS